MQINKKNIFCYISILIYLNLNFPVFSQFPILLYHAHPNLGYTDERFIEHTNFLKNNDYHTVSLEQFYEWYKNNKPMPIRPIVITFDDNYIMLYTNVFPILKEKKFIITNFTITNMVGYETGLHYCDWNEINIMENSGLVSHESHSVSHPYLTQISTAQAQNEIKDSKTAIDTNIPNKICRFIAYPYGDYNSNIISLCQDAGYTCGLTTVTGFNYHDTPPFELRRLAVDYDDLTVFKERIGYNALPQAPPGKGWTIDNEDVNFIFKKSEWQLSISASGYYGKNYRYCEAGDGSKIAKWAAYLPFSGRYNVYAWWVSGANGATNAPYEIHHYNGIELKQVSQRANGGKWNLLGTYYFSENTPAEIILKNNANGVVIADGVWFEPLDKEANLWCLF